MYSYERQAASGDPYWIHARYPGKAQDGTPFKKGDMVLYWPKTKIFMVGEKAESAWKRFESEVSDEEVYNRTMSASYERQAFVEEPNVEALSEHIVNIKKLAVASIVKLNSESWNRVMLGLSKIVFEISSIVTLLEGDAATAEKFAIQLKRMSQHMIGADFDADVTEGVEERLGDIKALTLKLDSKVDHGSWRKAVEMLAFMVQRITGILMLLDEDLNLADRVSRDLRRLRALVHNASVRVDKPKVKRWMLQHIQDHVDRRTGEVNSTTLAEEAASVFELYEDTTKYDIPEIVFDLAVDVADDYEAGKGNDMRRSYDYSKTARAPEPEHLFKAMHECVEKLLSARVAARDVHQMLGDVRRDATGISFSAYDDPDVRKVGDALYALDREIGEIWYAVEKLEKDLKKKVVK